MRRLSLCVLWLFVANPGPTHASTAFSCVQAFLSKRTSVPHFEILNFPGDFVVPVHPISGALSFSPAFDGYVYFSPRDRLIAIGGPTGAPSLAGRHSEHFSRLWKSATGKLYRYRRYERRLEPIPETEPHGRLMGVSEDTLLSVTASFYSRAGIQVWDNFHPQIPRLTLPDVDSHYGTFHHETREWIELTPHTKSPIRAFSFNRWRSVFRRISYAERSHRKIPTRLTLCALGHRWAETVRDSENYEWLYVWETLTGKLLLSAQIPNAREIRFSTDGQFIGAVSHDQTRIFEVSRSEASPQVLSQRERNLYFSPDNRYVVVGEGVRSHVVVWDRSLPEPKQVLRIQHAQPLTYSRGETQPWLAVLRYNESTASSQILLLDFYELVRLAAIQPNAGSGELP